MAKILVADDNSNVQKTMALALADLGVEMTSVNNGEAAVRKLADVSPDLVLADIFMPVRNGYEVCEYVKKDPRFAHVPVILLVGAFDPLDEREAQRVGADGILKKPFVPPDPLISMVKTLLDRSMSERLVGVSAGKRTAAVQAKVASKNVPEAPAPVPTIAEEPSPEEIPAHLGRVTFGEGAVPVAFGQLLDSPAQSTAGSGAGVLEPVDDEQILTSSRDATLGEPSFWRNDSPEEEPEAKHTEDSKDELSLRKWGQEEEPLSRREDAALLRPVEPVEFAPPEPEIEPLELVREDQEVESTSHVDSLPVVLDPAAQSPLTVESGRAPELAANPLEWLATAPPQRLDAAPLSPVLGWDEDRSMQHEDQSAQHGEVEPEPFPGNSHVDPAAISGSDAIPAEPAQVSGIDEFEIEPTPTSSGLPPKPTPISQTHALETESAPTSRGLGFHVPVKQEDPAPSPASFETVHAVEPIEFSEPAPEPDAQETHEASDTSSLQTPPPAPAAQSPEDTARSVPIKKWAEMTDSLEQHASEIVNSRVLPHTVHPGEDRPEARTNPEIAAGMPWEASKPHEPLHTETSLNQEIAANRTPASNPTATVDPIPAVTPTAAANPAELTAGALSSAPGVPDAALVEAVVQKVLDKMSPQVVDIITKEFLRPVVQALVHREIKKQ